MKKSTKAALFSGLVFPGIGHLILKQYLRGSILLVSTLIALSIIVRVAVRQALAVVDRIESGEIAAGTGSVTELASRSIDSADDSTVTVAFAVIVVCWLFGIIDSYRLGSIQEKSISRT